MTTNRLILGNELRELERLHAFLTESGEANGVDKSSLYRLNLICDELVTNIISYGFPERRETAPRIEIGLTHEPERLLVVIADNGVAFNPLLHPEPDTTAGIEERGIGGLGIHFTLRLTTGASYERIGEQNILRLTLNCRQPEEE